MRLPLGMIALLVVSVLIYFGLAQRVLDRLRLSDKGALAFIAALILGSYINIPIPTGANYTAAINVGGGLVPVALALYLLFKAGTRKELFRALVGVVVTAGVIYFIGSVVQKDYSHGGFTFMDPLFLYPLVGGAIAYIISRSRRGAFVAATLGVLALDFIHWGYLITNNIPGGRVHIGGAGAYDAIILSGIFAVLLAEIVGETRERLQGGPDSRGRDPKLIRGLKNVEFSSMLGDFNSTEEKPVEKNHREGGKEHEK